MAAAVMIGRLVATSKVKGVVSPLALVAAMTGQATAKSALTAAYSPVAVIKTRVVTASGDVTVTGQDYLVVVNKSVACISNANLPATPITNQTHVIKDGKGDAGTNNITIVPAAGNIDGAANFVMNSNYQAVTVVYNGSQWNVV
jgi:hypothetical protein